MDVTLLASAHLARIAANLMVAMPLVGLTLFGWQHGIFLAVIAGLQVLGSFVAALAFAPVVAAGVEALDCPPTQSLGVAYLVTFVAGLLLTRLAVGAGVPDGAVRFAPIFDNALGGACGALAGFVLSGSLLVGWSLFSPPESLRLDASGLNLDAGARLLVTFARCVEPDPARRNALLGGNASAADRGLLDCYRDGDWRTARRPVVEPSGDGAGEDFGEVDGAGTAAGAAAPPVDE